LGNGSGVLKPWRANNAAGGFAFAFASKDAFYKLSLHKGLFSWTFLFSLSRKKLKIFFFNIQVFNVLISKKVFNEFTQISIFQIIRRFRYAL